MQGQTFSKWLKAQGRRDDPVGDLSRDSQRSSVKYRKPRGKVGIYRRWKAFLHDHQACPEALEALRCAYKEYRAEMQAGQGGAS